MDNKSIFTERLILRRFKDEDTEPFYDIMKKPIVTKYLGSGEGKTWEDVKRILNSFEKHWTEKGYGVFAVEEKESGKLMRYSGLRFLEEAGKTEIMYAFDDEFWGKGFATEAAEKVMKYAKENTELSDLIALAYPENIGSKRVIEKIGFEYIDQREFFGHILNYYYQKIR